MEKGEFSKPRVYAICVHPLEEARDDRVGSDDDDSWPKGQDDDEPPAIGGSIISVGIVSVRVVRLKREYSN